MPGAEQTRRVWRSTSPQTRTTNEDGERSLARAGDLPAARPAAGSTGLDGPREPDSSELSRYDPVREPLESYQSRIRRQSAALAQIRDPVPDGALDLALQLSSMEAELYQRAWDDRDRQVRMLKR